MRNYLCVLLVTGLLSLAPIASETIPADSDISTESDDITEKACNSSLQPAVITEPGYIYPPLLENGTYMEKQDCRWLLQAPSGSIATVNFTFVEVVETFPCHFANITVYDGSLVTSERMLRLCGHDDSPVLRASQTKVLIVFQSGRVVEGRGFEALFQVQDIYESGCEREDFDSMGWPNGGFYSPNWPLVYPGDAHCVWRITADQPVRLQFADFDLGGSMGDCGSDSVYVYNLDGAGHEVLLGRFCGGYTPFNLGSTHTGLVVKFESGEESGSGHTGFRLNFLVKNTTEAACGASQRVELDWAPGLITSPNTDQSQCSWRLTAPITRLIRLSVAWFDLPECSHCGCAGLEIYMGPTHNSPLIGRFCGSGWAEPLAIGSNQVLLQYDSYQLYNHKGFQVLYDYEDISDEACGSGKPVELSHDDGVITSPNYNQGNYPNSANCQWLVISSRGYAVTLEFRSLEIEHCERCKCDYLSVHNGDDPSLSHTHVGTYCGSYPPNPVTSTLPVVFLTFVSDYTNTYRGFHIDYRFTYMADKACGPEQLLSMSHDPGEILSEGYEIGADYKPNSNCLWLITADPDETVELEVVEFELEGGDRCEFDYLEIYDGMDESAELIARLCDTVAPSVYTSSGQRMFLKFHSNNIIEKTGFFFKYNFRDSGGDSGIGFLPAVLIIIIILGVVVMIAAYCRVNNQFGKFTAWLRRVTGRERPSEVELQPPSSANSTSAPASDRNERDTAFVPTPARAVVCPPSEIDNMHYFAIADYAPPSYEEATANPNTVQDGSNTNSQNTGEGANQNHINRGETANRDAGETADQNRSETANQNRGETANQYSTGHDDRSHQNGANRGERTNQTSGNTSSTNNSRDNTCENHSLTFNTSTPRVSTTQFSPGITARTSRVHNTQNSSLETELLSSANQNAASRQTCYPGISSPRPSCAASRGRADAAEIQSNGSVVQGNPDMGISLLRQSGLFPTINPNTTPYTQNSTRQRGTPNTSPSSEPQRSQSAESLLHHSTRPSHHGNPIYQRSLSTEPLTHDQNISLHNPVYSALHLESSAECDVSMDGTPSRQHGTGVKDKPRVPGQIGRDLVEVSGDRKASERWKSVDRIGIMGVDNGGYVSGGNVSDESDRNGSIVLHRLQSRDQNTSV